MQPWANPFSTIPHALDQHYCPSLSLLVVVLHEFTTLFLIQSKLLNLSRHDTTTMLCINYVYPCELLFPVKKCFTDIEVLFKFAVHIFYCYWWENKGLVIWQCGFESWLRCSWELVYHNALQCWWKQVRGKKKKWNSSHYKTRVWVKTLCLLLFFFPFLLYWCIWNFLVKYQVSAFFSKFFGVVTLLLWLIL